MVKDLLKTVTCWECSSEWKQGDEPYYSVNAEKNDTLYQKSSAAQAVRQISGITLRNQLKLVSYN